MKFLLGMHGAVSAAVVIIALCVAPLLVRADQVDGYKPVDLSGWTPRTAASAMALVEPLYRAHPERMEGRPELKIHLRKEAGVLIIDIEATGFLDDSVRGEKYRAVVVPSAKGWHLRQLGIKRSCNHNGSKAWRTGQCS